MRGVIVFFAIIFITLLVGVIVLYFYFEKPAQEEYNKYANVINFSIYATENGQYVQTNYEIKVDDILYSTGVTLLESPIMESIHTNSSVIIYNKNRETQEYYTTSYSKYISGNIEPQRVELKLIKPGKLIISADRNLTNTNQILVNISSTSTFHSPFMCFKWSSHLITVSSVFQEVPKLERYELYDKCYNMNREIVNETFTLPVNFKTFGTLDNTDFIKMVFIDSDCIDSLCSTFTKNDKNESIDIGATDVIFEIQK